MIKYSSLKNLFNNLDINVEEYKAETEEQDIELPFLVYAQTEAQQVFADGKVFFSIVSVNALLVLDTMNDSAISSVEQLFNDNSITYMKNIEFSDSERVYEITYTFQAING